MRRPRNDGVCPISAERRLNLKQPNKDERSKFLSKPSLAYIPLSVENPEMWFSSFRIHNYKSFEDSGIHQLSAGINLIVGQNNAGKTALLRAIGDLRIEAAPHRDSRLRREQPFDPRSRVDLEISLTGRELLEGTLRAGSELRIPCPTEFGPGTDDAIRQINDLLDVRARGFRQASSGGFGVERGESPSVTFCGYNSAIHHSLFLRPNRSKAAFLDKHFITPDNDDTGAVALRLALAKTYYFDAYRVPSGRWQHGNSTTLANNAQNLPEVLINLQHSPSAYRRYLDQVRRVLPLVKHVSVKPISAQENEIFVWNLEESTERDDLAIPLAECGTGIGQVLALLYVVMHSSGDILLIDEPNSFLHPRATRELISIFRADKRHQYIISTHSPEVIAASKPEKLYVLTIKNEITEIQELSGNDISAARQVLEEVGSRLSDVFGIDQVIWVEGPTEVECFPMLLGAADLRLSTGAAIVPLRSTGDLEGRHADALADIYRNLSAANSLLPQNAAIIMDGDKRGNKRLLSAERAFGEPVTFLRRRTYENYLLHPGAICSVLNGLPFFKEYPASEETVRETMSRLANELRFGAETYQMDSDAWLANVDAPNLLDDLFQHLSTTTEIFRKTKHSSELTRWLLDNDRAFVQPIIDELRAATDDVTQPL